MQIFCDLRVPELSHCDVTMISLSARGTSSVELVTPPRCSTDRASCDVRAWSTPRIRQRHLIRLRTSSRSRRGRRYRLAAAAVLALGVLGAVFVGMWSWTNTTPVTGEQKTSAHLEVFKVTASVAIMLGGSAHRTWRHVANAPRNPSTPSL